MLVLKELIKIIAPQKIKNIKILGGVKSKVRQLYKGISEGSIENEEMAMTLLFPNANNPKQAFADIKRATKKSLIDALFIINIDKATSIYHRNYINCLKQYIASKILITLGFRKGAIDLAEKTIKKAVLYEFTEISLSLGRHIIPLHSNNTRNIKKYYSALNLVKQQHNHLNKEILMLNCFTEIEINLNSIKRKEKLFLLLDTYKSIAEKHIEKNNTYHTLFYAYNILIIYYEQKSDFENIIFYAEEAINAISQKNYSLPTIPFLFFFSKSISYTIQNRQWNKAEDLVNQCLNLLSNKTYNYHALLVYQVMIGFHSGNYQLAYEALKLHKKAKLDAPLLKEQWQVIEAWIMLFAGWGKIDLDGEKPNFRVFKFINSVPNFIKDKPGHNSIIQLLKFLFFFQKEKYVKLYDMSTPFKLYAHRYLKPKITARTRYIIRTVCAVADEGFDKRIGMQKAKTYYEKLKNTPVNFLEQKTVEIVPFELVAETVFENL
ncbi:MAG: hypothetical protein AB8G86_24575 [Saprospiraceae bacterium]